MCCTRAVACVVLCGCLAPIVRAPQPIPGDGVVECTDSMETPITAAVIGVASSTGAVYASTQQGTIDSGGMLWVPALAGLGVAALIAAAEGASRVHECRDAKQRGAAIAEAARRKVDRRAQAGVEWKRAAAAARADDCATVRELDPQIDALDTEFHAVVFMRDVAIARCLSTPPALP